jgi:hypothetical protein
LVEGQNHGGLFGAAMFVSSADSNRSAHCAKTNGARFWNLIQPKVNRPSLFKGVLGLYLK